MLSKYKHRNESVSIAKGIGILLVVIGHCCVAEGNTVNVVGWQNFIHHMIYSFHMPLFFVLSGYMFKIDNIDNPVHFVEKKIKGLYIPYLKWMLAFLLLHNIFDYIGIFGSYLNGEIPHHLGKYGLISGFVNAITFGYGINGSQFLGGFWFLPVLFQSSLIVLFFYYVMVKSNIITSKFLTGGGILFFIIISMLLYYTKVNEFFISGKVMLASAFFVTGYYLSKIRFSNIVNIVYFILFLFIIIIGSYYTPVSYGGCNDWISVPYVFLFGFCGSWMLIIASHYLAKYLPNILKNPMLYMGENTLIILALHFLCFKLVDFIKILYYKMPYTSIQEFPIVSSISNGNGVIWWMIYIVAGVFIPLIAMLLYKKITIKIKNKQK